MALYFEHVKLLGYRHTPVFLDAGLRYRVEKQLTIQGRVADITNSEGVSELINKENAVLNAATDYDDIVLNGISFGRGRITNIDFEGGVMVREDNYTYEITCYEDGNLFNALAGVYTGLTWTDARKIESIDEEFEFTDSNGGDKQYSHSLSVRFVENATPTDGINLAKALAQTFFNAVSGLSAFLGEYSSAAGAKRVYTESYDLVTAEASFTENVIIPKDRAGNYSYQLTYDIQVDEAGFIEITERLSITGLTSPRFAGAREGYEALIGASYSRSSTVYAAYGFSDAVLFAQPIRKGATVNKFTGEIEATTSFSNNPRYQDIAIWEWSLEANKDNEGYYTVTESGSVTGIGRPFVNKYENAKEFYEQEVRPNVAGRVQSFYESISGRTYTLRNIAESLDRNEVQGSIGYSFTFTDNNLYQDGDIKKLTVQKTVSNPVHLIQKYNIFNYKEIVQTQYQSTLGNVSLNIEMRGKRGTAIAVYLNAAKAIALANQPATTDRFIENCEYSFSPEGTSFTFTLEFVFVGTHKSLNDVTID